MEGKIIRFFTFYFLLFTFYFLVFYFWVVAVAVVVRKTKTPLRLRQYRVRKAVALLAQLYRAQRAVAYLA